MRQRPPKLSLEKQEMLMRHFVAGTTAGTAGVLTMVNRKTANRFFTYYRECIFSLYGRAPRFSGEVEMDQAFFGRGSKKKTSDKRFLENTYGDPNYFKKRRKKKKKPGITILVFGILRRGGDVYTHVIQKADRDTLFPIIHLVVKPKTVIYTDAWPAFNDLNIDNELAEKYGKDLVKEVSDRKSKKMKLPDVIKDLKLHDKKIIQEIYRSHLGYEHGIINHSTGYINRKGTHTGGIDSFWGQAKRLIGNKRGRISSRRTFLLHLKEAEWRWNTRSVNREDEKVVFKKRLSILKKII